MIGAKKALFLSGDMGLGGGAMFVLNLCEGLRCAGGQWRGLAGVFTGAGQVGGQLTQRGGEMIGPFRGPLLHEDYMEEMHRECARLRPDAVIANLGGNAFDFLRYVPESVLRVAIIHSDDNCVYRQVERYLPWIDVVVGVSARNCEVIQGRIGAAATPVVQVACGVPIPEGVSRKPSEDGTLRILYLGRVAEQQKRAGLLQRVIRKSLGRDPSIQWTIAGDGPELGSLREGLADFGERVSFLGAVAYDRVPDLFTVHDVFFLCSSFEGLPLAMLEAMAGGLVPVVSDLPSGISEVVDDTNGIRVDKDDEEAYVRALLHLSGNPDLVTLMGNRAAADVSKGYSVEAMTARWAYLLETYSRPPGAEWPNGCIADVPPEIRHLWRNHPSLRPLRKCMKSLNKRS